MIDSTVSNEEILLRISGEIKQKIARVRSHSSQLQRAFAGAMDGEHQRWFESIEKDCLDLNSIIHNLISLDNQYDEHHHPIQVDTVHLNRFLTTYVADYTSAAAQCKRIQVSYEDIDENIHIHIDPQAISEALSHILSNAAKFSQPETQVVIKLVRYANVANLSISDQGIGIPKKLRPYLFKKFSKATPPRHRGRGVYRFGTLPHAQHHRKAPGERLARERRGARHQRVYQSAHSREDWVIVSRK